MGARMATRFRVAAPNGRFWGTCPTWAGEFGPEATVVSERVQVHNARTVACACCGKSHPDVPTPYVD